MNTVVITGAAGGIGIETVKALAREDRNLLCIDVSDTVLERLAPLASSLPGRIVPVASQLQSPADCRSILTPHMGSVTALAHLAGVFERDVDGIDDMSVFERAITSNLTNAYLMGHACFEARATGTMMTQVYISSSAYRRGAPEHGPYGIAKAGLVGLTRSLGRRFAPHARVNAIAPALIDTPMPAEVIRQRGLDKASAEIPLGRIGQPQEVASVVAFLLGEASSFINCQTINVDGGLIPS
jgi:NAD(P)-dependent dehydrogenase (short-subunit alcohol dehydrogenase family)